MANLVWVKHLHLWVCNAKFGRYYCIQCISAQISPCICSTIWRASVACNKHKIECFFCRRALIEYASEVVCCTVQWFYLFLNIIIILQWVISTHQGISLGQNIVHAHHSEIHLMEQVGYTFWGKNNTDCCVAIKGNFVFSSIVTTKILKTLESTNTGAEHAYQQALDDSQPYIMQCVLP